ncbi:unnamed protein product [Acanthoscelides obtectus]|uniref:Uncharacterized protein n=1 Tax=Acanthoscelides obtectus TaxID=200917 RepID=A0A9P0LQT5_ACAOB|nr:unnamed protein product [Acanthoscelides obtectus]CAK1651779.1 hypothetical protein AOBTE_LOCUS17448 [Acanthoscelides obtectus]
MSPYSRYRPLPVSGSDGLAAVLHQNGTPGCRQSPTSACRFLRWISRFSPQPGNKQGIGNIGELSVKQ